MQHSCQDHAHDPQAGDAGRRDLVHGTALTAAALFAAPLLLSRRAQARPATGARDVLVHVFLRGASDGLALVPPYGDAEYYLRRPTLAIPPPGQLNGALPLGGTSLFGLAPAAAPLLTPYNAGHLLIAHATGLVDPSRSHFDAQRFMELGTTGQHALTTSTGWIGRLLQTSTPAGNGLLRGIALADGLPVSFQGGPGALPIKDPDNFLIPGQASTATQRRLRLANMYAADVEPLSSAAEATFETIDLLAGIDFVGYAPAGGAVYPNSNFGRQLKTTAALIKAGLGLEVISLDYGGWDLHNQLGPITGAMATKMDDLARGLEAFYKDLLPNELRRVTVVVLSEFGRRAFENASGGTDHGHGNALLVMGYGVNGGRVLANWPGLGTPQLDNGDLAITIDHRDILAEIAFKRLGNPNLATIFPNYTPTFRGVV